MVWRRWTGAASPLRQRGAGSRRRLRRSYAATARKITALKRRPWPLSRRRPRSFRPASSRSRPIGLLRQSTRACRTARLAVTASGTSPAGRLRYGHGTKGPVGSWARVIDEAAPKDRFGERFRKMEKAAQARGLGGFRPRADRVAHSGPHDRGGLAHVAVVDPAPRPDRPHRGRGRRSIRSDAALCSATIWMRIRVLTLIVAPQL